MAFIFFPGVSISGESPLGDAERVVRGVEGDDMVQSWDLR